MSNIIINISADNNPIFVESDNSGNWEYAETWLSPNLLEVINSPVEISARKMHQLICAVSVLICVIVIMLVSLAISYYS